MKDEYYMKMALQEAQKAFGLGEIPVGAVIVSQDKILAKSHNQTEILKDFTAHAEILAYSAASSYLSNKYLNNCTLYVTLEPCVMCAGASSWTRISRLVYGAKDPRNGFSNYQPPILPSKTEVVSGVLAEDCLNLIQSFFKQKRH